MLPDLAAQEITGALYDHLLRGRTIEEVVRRLRGDLARNAHLPNAAWLAGLPLLCTSLAESAPPLTLAPLLIDGAPAGSSSWSRGLLAAGARVDYRGSS